ncbi:MAG TPA: 2'-5' RNA ligase family protein [Chitinophagaceae bacterium]|nr:2'-5' RNA ligase family protein [Chitinophagaceae bacterium]
MQASINTIPGYRVQEYLLVLPPQPELASRISQAREQFAAEYDCQQARMGRPHIVLASFTQYLMLEERLMNRLRLVAMGVTPFKVELRDFGSFPSHSIFFNVVSRVPVQGLVKRVRQETQRLMRLDEEHKPYFNLEPHIPLVRKLLPWQYEKGWMEFSQRHFSGRFIADSMVLLKRPLGEMKFQVARQFAFQNLPVFTRQGELFA